MSHLSTKYKINQSYLFVAKTVTVELKSVQNLVSQHEVQLVNYLNAIKKNIGLTINFGPAGVEVK